MSLQDKTKEVKGKTNLVEVWYLRDVAEVDDGKVLDFLGDRVERFVHHHTLCIPVVSKANNHDTVLFRFDRFIYVPARREVR